jgi:hypothetical protein
MERDIIYGKRLHYSYPNFVERICLTKREEMYIALSKEVPLNTIKNVLDVGIATVNVDRANFFEQYFPYPERITGLAITESDWPEKKYPGLKMVVGDGCDMMFDDNSFDLVFSSAVWEHVGSRKRQAQFLRELLRVSSKYVFITTPNRWFPIEMHSKLPLLHWLPKNVHRKILGMMGHDILSKEENLNLLDKDDIKIMAEEVWGGGGIKSKKLGCLDLYQIIACS